VEQGCWGRRSVTFFLWLQCWGVCGFFWSVLVSWFFIYPPFFSFAFIAFALLLAPPSFFCVYSPPLLSSPLISSYHHRAAGLALFFLFSVIFFLSLCKPPGLFFFALHGHGCFHLAPCFRGWFFLVFFFGEAWNGILGIVGLHQSTLLVCRGCIETRDSSTHEIFHLKRDLCINAPLHRHP